MVSLACDAGERTWLSGEMLSSVIDELRIDTAANSCRSCTVSARYGESCTHAGQDDDAAGVSEGQQRARLTCSCIA